MWATYNLSYLYVDIQENGTADLVNFGNDALISAYALAVAPSIGR